MLQDAFGLPVHLSAPFDFSFLGRYGRPFCVFDEQDSGNIAFGVNSQEYGKLFINFAGAPTPNAKTPPHMAVQNLKNAAPLYQTLRHPALVQLLGQGEIAGGYALIFRWFEGETLYSAQARQKLSHQPLNVRLRMLDHVFDFHLHCAVRNHVSADFYEHSLLIDFLTGRLAICNIDRYRAMPACNDLGRMPGSARFLSPEEYEKGAPLDGLTMQYTMGALAFVFLAQDGSHDADAWTAARSLHAIAERAVSLKRTQRYPSLGAFVSVWREAVRHSTVY